MDVEFETDKFPVIKAKHFQDVVGRRDVRLIVIHSMEAPEKGSTAENVARFFQDPPSPVSAHLCIDNNSIVQCVFDNDIAFAAPGANHNGIHLELAGPADERGIVKSNIKVCTFPMEFKNERGISFHVTTRSPWLSPLPTQRHPANPPNP